MWDDVNELELLALIEDELSPEEATVVRRRLVERPDVLALVDRLREDRDVLLTTPAPDVPVDVLDRLESLLARPMLMSQPPGQLRRAQQRQRRRRQWTRFAAAAMLVLAGGGGVWALVRTLTPAPGPGPVAVVDGERRPDPSRVFTPPPGPVTSEAVDLTPPIAVVDGRSGQDAPQPSANEESPIRADFVLVILADAGDEVEDIVTRVARGLGDDVVLVRNFSEAEFRQMLEKQRLANAGNRSTGPDGLARMDGGSQGDEVEWSQQQRIRPTISPIVDGDELRSRQLAGPKDMAPSFTEQLELSNLGATHTITIRASQLPALLAELDEAMDGRTALDMLSKDRTAAPTVTIDGQVKWVINARMVRESLRALDDRENAIVVLPVVIRADS